MEQEKEKKQKIILEYSFRSGFNQIQIGKVIEFKKEMMSALSINSRTSWVRRLNGNIIPKVSEKVIIEQVFKNYGVTKNIWGD